MDAGTEEGGDGTRSEVAKDSLANRSSYGMHGMLPQLPNNQTGLLLPTIFLFQCRNPLSEN